MSARAYEGLDRHGRFHRVERRFQSDDPLCLLPTDAARRWNDSALEERLSVRELDAHMERRVPGYVRAQLDAVLQQARELAEEGRAEEPPADAAGWRRSLILSWHHAADVATVCHALGHARSMSLGNHDLCEYVPAARILASLEDEPSPWYARWLEGLAPSEPVNVGFLNPHLCASLCRWGEAKVGTQNAMDAHRLSGHHLGNPDSPLDWIERSVNFVFHHLPREHYGIRLEPLCGWEELDARIATDPAIKDDPIEQAVVADVRVAIAALEEAGFLVPWHRLELGEDAVPGLALEHSRAVLLDHVEQARRLRVGAEDRLRARGGMAPGSIEARRARALEGSDLGPSPRGERAPDEDRAALGAELERVLSTAERPTELQDVLRRARGLQVELQLTEQPEILVRHMQRLARAGSTVGSDEVRTSSPRRARSLEGTPETDVVAEPEELLYDHAEVLALVREHVDLQALASALESQVPGASAELTLEALASEIHSQLEQPGGRRARFLFGNTAIKKRDVISVVSTISTASPVMLLLGSQLKLFGPAALLGGLVGLGMALAGIHNQAVPLSPPQLAVLVVLKQAGGVSLAPETILQKLPGRYRPKTLASLREVLVSLTQAPSRSGDPKRLVMEEGGRWRILDV